MDTNNNPHIVYKQGTINNIRYHYYTGTEWKENSLLEVDLPGSGEVSAVHCTFVDFRLHLAYIRSGVVYYGYFFNNRWHIRTVGSGQMESFIRIVVHTGVNPEIIIVTHSDSTRGSLKKFITNFY